MKPNRKAIDKGYKKRSGRIMFPTSHDITMDSLNGCLAVLKKLLDSDNEVLITTKPRLTCTKIICNAFYGKMDLIQFRFTITSLSNNLLSFWEPDAPCYEERLTSLIHAYQQGYKTSISIEPFLDEDPFQLVKELEPYVTESIWIGKMNYIQSGNLSLEEKPYFKHVRAINSKENLLKIVEHSESYPFLIRIKDSVLNYLSK